MVGSTVNFEYCTGCFGFRVHETDQWIAQFDNGTLFLSDSRSQAVFFYRWRAGTFDWPGDTREAVLALPQSVPRRCLQGSNTGGPASTVVCANGNSSECLSSDERCLRHLWRAEAVHGEMASSVVDFYSCTDNSTRSSLLLLPTVFVITSTSRSRNHETFRRKSPAPSP